MALGVVFGAASFKEVLFVGGVLYMSLIHRGPKGSIPEIHCDPEIEPRKMCPEKEIT